MSGFVFQNSSVLVKFRLDACLQSFQFILAAEHFFQGTTSSPNFAMDKKSTFVGIFKIVYYIFNLIRLRFNLTAFLYIELALYYPKMLSTAIQLTEMAPP